MATIVPGAIHVQRALLAIGPVAVQDRQPDDQSHRQQRPPQDRDRDAHRVARDRLLDQRREGGDGDQGDDGEGDRAHGEEEGEAAQGDEPSTLLLVVGHVDRADEVLHPARRRPQRHRDADDRGHTQAAIGRLGDGAQLLAHEVAHLRGSGREQVGHLTLDLRGIGDQAVEGDERDQARDEGEQREERHPCAEQDDVVGLHLLLGAEEDVSPPGGRHL